MSSSTTAAEDAAAASMMEEMGGVDFHGENHMDTVEPPRRLLRAEAILARRTARFLLVVETIQDANNYQAILRTADAFGIQNVWVVESGGKRKHEEKAARDHAQLDAGSAEAIEEDESSASASASPPANKSHDLSGTVSMAAGRWLTLRYFSSTTECIAALRADNREIWATALSRNCVPFDRAHCMPLPERLAIVLGRELDGVSQEMIAASSRQVFLPMQGFSESFNVSVAGALVCQRLFDLAPEASGQMDAQEVAAVRRHWYHTLTLGTPGAEKDYMEYWLPNCQRVVSAMQAAIAADGEASVLRPPVSGPQISVQIRRRMAKEGQRVIIMPGDKQ